MSFPGQRLAKFIELVLVWNSRHVHEAFLKGRRSLLEDRMASGLETRGRDCARYITRLGRRRDGGKERTEARTDDSDFLSIDFRTFGQPIEHRLAGGLPSRDADPDAQEGALAGPGLPPPAPRALRKQNQ